MFGFFLMVSATMWLVNKLSYSYQTNVNVAVWLTNSNIGELITDGERQRVRCLVQARGYDILLHKISPSQPLLIDISRYENVALSANERYLQARNFQPLILQTLGKGFEFVYLQGDTVKFKVDVLASKKVPVHPNISITCAPQYIQHGKLRFLPDSVIISGALNDIEQVNAIETLPVAMTRVDRSLQGKIATSVPKFSKIALSAKQIYYQVEILRFTEVKKHLPIVCQNLPKNVDIQLFPSSSDVSFCLNIEQSQNFGFAPTPLVVDYNDIANNLSGQLPVQLSHLPDYVLLANVKEPIVRFVLTKNDLTH
ncbi:hypothetical protein FACS189456_4330 [Bacteroidia bacterium]|nr:hypothetical protein FACS189456_4330 [Bacteroidia bacterium]